LTEDAKDNTHGDSPGYGESATLQFAVDLRRIGFIVDHQVVQFDPGVRLEWNNLRSNDKVSRITMVAEKYGGCGGTLQTQDTLEIEDTSKVYGAADLLCRVAVPGLHLAWKSFQDIM
jgi:hypothetical protein